MGTERASADERAGAVSARPWAREAGRPVRLGIYTQVYPGFVGEGGIGSYVKRLAHEMSAGGHEVHALVPVPLPRDDARDGPVHVHFVHAPHLPVVDKFWPGAGACWGIGRAMKRLVREHRLDVVEFPNWAGHAPYFALGRRVPMVVRLHTSALEAMRIDGLPMTRMLKADVRRERMTSKMADVLVTHSVAHQRTMAEELGVPAESIRVIPHGIEPAPELPGATRDENTVFYLGRLERRKGTKDLLDAVPLVLKEVPEARFVLVGFDRPHCPGGRLHSRYLEDEFPPEVRRRVEMLGIRPDDEVEQWMRRATVFVAPSLYESFGLVFLEAMRWGAPVIGAATGGIPEVVEDGTSGVLVPPENPRGLAAAIVGLLRDPARRRALGEAGRERCTRQFSTRLLADRMVDLYRETIERWRQ